MIDDVAFSIQSASAWAWIFTFAHQTCLCKRTLSTGYTLRPTRWRGSDETSLTRTYSMVINNAADTVWSAGGRVTGIDICWKRNDYFTFSCIGHCKSFFEFDYLQYSPTWTIGRHATNASPEVCGGHEHVGIWLTTSHLASCPQIPMHGSMQRKLIHALFGEQSVFMVHSGRQPEYGSPK